MKRQLLYSSILMVSLAIFIISCKKELEYSNTHSQHGHLILTKTFSSEVALKWMDMQLRLFRTTAVAPPLNNSRYFAYSGIALYESVQPGMPGYKSLSGQLNELQNLPQTNPGLAYHWPTCANTALAYMNRSLFATTSAANIASIDSLENALNEASQSVVGEPTFQRSVDFGKAVAQIIFDWSKTDGSATIHPAFTPPGTLPGSAPGLWIPTYPGDVSLTPYWGTNRLFVQGSLNGSAPPAMPDYSEDPKSDYYQMQKEVYDISQTLTPEQIAQGLYYRDNPGYRAGAHYLSILCQILVNEQPALDKSALAYMKTGIGIAESQIACWQIKYQYNIQRPINYIRTVLGYPLWNSLFNTPAHPDFPSGHSTTAGAAEVMLNDLFGDNYQFTNHAYDYLGMPPQTYTSFGDMAEQIGMSRVYAGIHTRYACEKAREQGNKIAQNILAKLRF